MSEYQYYEFQAIDRPLTREEMATLRSYSTRATITPYRFTNHYEWGSFKGDPSQWVERYFDAYLYLANWGTRQLMLRLPRGSLDLAAIEPYFPEEWAVVRATEDALILEYRSESEESDGYWHVEEEDEALLASFIPVRTQLLSGDPRVLYLGWLLCAQEEVLAVDLPEPPVPPGLGQLDAALQAFAEFLRIDQDLIAVAAERSEPLATTEVKSSDLVDWVRGLGAAEKDALLTRVVDGTATNLRAELLARYRREHAAATHTSPTPPRTVGELLAGVERQRALRERREAEQRRREAELAARARAAYLDTLMGREEALWHQALSVIEEKRVGEYNEAIRLLADLRDLATRQGHGEEFKAQIATLRERYPTRSGLQQRMSKAGL